MFNKKYSEEKEMPGYIGHKVYRNMEDYKYIFSY